MRAISSGRAQIPFFPRAVLGLAGVLLGLLVGSVAPSAAELPEIRLSSTNVVPACTTPDRLMAFLKRRNATLSPRFRDIARHYKTHGERWGVRWDYAFFQMAIETNFLTYRRPDGRMGDVDPKQNNFAGIGTTGGGVPGDSFPDVSTGVLGQIQHLVAYSGEAVANPVAQRTQLKQEHILAKSRELNRPVRFSDLARRWAVDPKYGSSIEWVAQKFRNEFCPAGGRRQEVEILPWQRHSDAAPAAAKSESASGVRTVWSKDGARADTTGGLPAPMRKTPSATASAGVPPVAAVAGPPAVAHPEGETPAQAEVAAAAAGEASGVESAETAEAGLAVFAPLALLAEMRIPGVPTQEPPTQKEAVADAVTPVVPTAAPAPKAEPPPGIVMGPPDTTVPERRSAAAGETTAFWGPRSIGGFLPPSGLGVKPGRCVVETATFAGDTTVLLKTPVGADLHYVALSVLDGFEASMTKSFLDARPQGGESLGVFPSKDAALKHARTLCPE